MSEEFLGGKIVAHHGDCLAVLPTLPECSIDSCVTDPPYHLTSIVKRMSKDGCAPVGFGSDGRYQRLSTGFMGKVWDGGDIAFRPDAWAEVFRVRLVTPRGGLVLDPFAGTGSTGEAAIREGMRAVLIEREAEYQADIRRRMALILAGPDERLHETIKASGRVESPGPLFEYDFNDDFAKSIDAAYEAIRTRVANGGPPWTPPTIEE
jgi:DNA modification methylase